MLEESDAVQWSPVQLNSGFLISLKGFSPRFSATVADESDTLHTLHPSRALHNVFFSFSSLPAFLLPALLVLPPIRQFSKHLSLPFSAPSSQHLPYFSLFLCAGLCVSISLCIWLSIQFLYYYSSFRNWLSYDNSEGIMQDYCSRCFDVWKESCRADMTVRMNVNRRGLS